jgi:hypothetical protein
VNEDGQGLADCKVTLEQLEILVQLDLQEKTARQVQQGHQVKMVIQVLQELLVKRETLVQPVKWDLLVIVGGLVPRGFQDQQE